jgi:hypothetical protein
MPMRVIPPSTSSQILTSDIERTIKLSAAPHGSGHDCFLKGIVVQFDVTAPIYVYPQMQRYHWFDIISSQSKMHCIQKMPLEKSCNKYVRKEAIDLANRLQEDYANCRIDIDELLSNLPMGYEYTLSVTTNYLQLKTMYHQRSNHRLEFWRECFVPFVKSLPLSYMITLDKTE